MTLFKPYSNVKDFLQRFTLLKIGKLHIRLHRIVGQDTTTLFHNHPFDYISIILSGGYTELVMKEDETKCHHHSFLSVIRRSHLTFHRIESCKKNTLSLFLTYGDYGWNAINISGNMENDGIFERQINGNTVWSKKQNGIWFIGNKNKNIALNETRHSIHQI